jgi:hypothetical protein
VPALSHPPPPAPLLFEHIFSLSLACAGVPPAGPRTVNLVGACCLLVGHKAPNECSSHGLPRTCTCRGLETHSSVNIQCCHGVESQRELSDMWRPLLATVPVIEPKYGAPLEDTRRFLSPLPPRAPRTRMTPPSPPPSLPPRKHHQTPTRVFVCSRTLRDFLGLPAAGFTTLDDGTIVKLYVGSDFATPSQYPRHQHP